MPERHFDVDALKEHLRPNGPWARESGARLTKARTMWQFTEADLAARSHVSLTTIRDAEAGRLVPRDYLRATLAGILRKDIDDLWPPLRLQRIEELALEPYRGAA